MHGWGAYEVSKMRREVVQHQKSQGQPAALSYQPEDNIAVIKRPNGKDVRVELS